MASIKLAASEGTEFSVESDVAEKSVLLKNMIEDVGESEVRAPFRLI